MADNTSTKRTRIVGAVLAATLLVAAVAWFSSSNYQAKERRESAVRLAQQFIAASSSDPGSAEGMLGRAPTADERFLISTLAAYPADSEYFWNTRDAASNECVVLVVRPDGSAAVDIGMRWNASAGGYEIESINVAMPK